MNTFAFVLELYVPRSLLWFLFGFGRFDPRTRILFILVNPRVMLCFRLVFMFVISYGYRETVIGLDRVYASLS